MLDLIYFLIAVASVLVTFPLWLFVGGAWAILVFFGKLVTYCLQVISNYFKYGDYAEGLVVMALTPFIALWDAVVAFFEPLGWVWDFARYDHPWWSLLIIFVLGIGYSVLGDQ